MNASVEPLQLSIAAESGYEAAIERFCTTVRLPVGMAGPVRVRGTHLDDSVALPIATTEGALVASCNRGCKALNLAEGAATVVARQAMIRAPGFRFRSVVDAHRFSEWIVGQLEPLRSVAAATSRHCTLIDVDPCVEGNHCLLRLSYETGEAAGQNMVTFASDAVCRHVLAHAPVEPERVYLEANASGDKKATFAALGGVRGRRVVAESVLPGDVLQSVLKCDAATLHDYWMISVMGAAQTGSIGLHGHVANVLAGAYIALGQDAACVAESAVGITRMQRQGDDLYASVTLPNVVVGSVGGGIGLPDQQACWQRMNLPAANRAGALAEVIAAVCLAGELSIAAALATDCFSDAHRRLGRKQS